ncbi:MAG: hypothetical protein OEO21_12385 [Candidatus Krumholzibacteria bacterium]|nr:hypothetical protein [Candidatus Krumholzibacteria bacterium]MDH3725003.1 hypothetical protein [Thermoleophilia bacterium]
MDADSRLLTIAAVFAAALSSSLILAPFGSAATTVVERDTRGRTITFDVRAPGADTRGYADILSGAAHGDEISSARFTVARESEVASFCGARAEACYRWTLRGGELIDANIVIPPWQPAKLRQVLLHEYAHHIDASSRVQPGAKVFDGTPRWFAARNMSAQLAAGRVDWLYAKGWSRAIGEIFAEDYVVLHNLNGRHRIAWLKRPDRAVLQALAADLGTVSPVVIASPGKSVVTRSHELRRAGVTRGGRSRTIALPRLRATQRLTVTGRLRGDRRARAVIRVRCRNRVLMTVRARKGVLKLQRKIPRGRCRVTIGARKAAVRHQLRIAIR